MRQRLILLTLCILQAGFARAVEPVSRYFEQLRQRRLFSVAEDYAMDRLTVATLSQRERAALVLELSRTYAEHAKFTSGDEHDDYWSRAEAVVQKAVKADDVPLFRLELESQLARLPAERGRVLRGQLELFPFSRSTRAKARKVFELAIKSLKAIEKELAEAHRQASLRSPADGLQAWELRALLQETRFELGRTYQEQALAENAGWTGRTGALQAARFWLSPLAEGSPDAPETWTAKVLLARNARLRDDRDRASALLLEVVKAKPSEHAVRFAVAEQARLLLADGNPPEAVRLLQQNRRRAGHATGELASLNVQALIGMRAAVLAKNDAILAGQLKTRIERELQLVQQAFGGYWGVRCARAWEHALQTEELGAPLATMKRKADAEYADGNLATAVTDYSRAASLATQSTKADIAFDFAFTAASIEIQLEHFDTAAKQLKDLTNRFPNDEQAPEGGLLHAFCLGKLYAADPTEERRDAYAEALEKHTRQHPKHATAGDAFWMLGNLEEQRLQVTKAVTLYAQVPAGHQHRPAAEAAVARCYEKVLERLEELREKALKAQHAALAERTVEWETQAVQTLQAMTRGDTPDDRWRAEVRLRLARIQLNRIKPQYAAADAELTRLTKELAAEGAPAEKTMSAILKTARQLRIVSLAGQGLVREAEGLVAEISTGSPAEVLAVLDGLMKSADSVPEKVRFRLGQLQLTTATALNERRDELDAEAKRRVSNCLAQAYIATQKPEQAMAVYRQVVKESPRDARVLASAAEFLMTAKHPPAVNLAKTYWQRLKSRQKPGSAPWLTSQIAIARCYLELGQKDECRKILTVTKLLHPKLGTPEIRAKFAALEAEANR